MCMIFEWDEEKNRKNQKLHHLRFTDIDQFEWQSALIVEDDRVAYGEIREIAYGYFYNRLTVVVFTEKSEDLYRIISWRKATKHEVRLYEENSY